MGNVQDPNDPFYKSQPGWVWEPQMGSWINTGGANAGGPAPAPAAPQPTGWDDKKLDEGNKAGFTSYEDRNDPLGAFNGFESTNRGPATTPTDPNKYGLMAKTGPSKTALAMRDLLGKRAMGEGIPGTALDESGAERARGAQAGLLQQLLDMAAGKTQSPAQMMLQQGADRNLADAAALTNSTRGLGATAAAGQVAGQRAQIGQETSRDMGILRLQEQMQASQAAAGLAGQMRGQDQALATAKAQVEVASNSLRENLKQKYAGMNLSEEEIDRRIEVEMAKVRSATAISLDTLAQEKWSKKEDLARNDRDFILKLVGGAGDALLGLAGM
jgi:hypothetical protein